MKAIKFFAIVAVMAFVAVACTNNTLPSVEKQPEGITQADVDSASYALGVYYGQMITMNNLGDMNLSEILKGMRDAMKGDNEEFDQMFVGMRMNNFMAKRNEALAAANKKAGEEFLAKNATEEGVQTTFKGLQYMVVRQGNGVFPTSKQDTITVHYEGSTMVDGKFSKVFDSSYEREEPATFVLGQVIEGWQDGLMFCDEGSEVILWIPSEMAYGIHGSRGIAPNETLKFKVELQSVKPCAAAEEAE